LSVDLQKIGNYVTIHTVTRLLRMGSTITLEIED